MRRQGNLMEVDMKLVGSRALGVFLTIGSAAYSEEARRSMTPEDLFAIQQVNEAQVSPKATAVVYTLALIDREKNRNFSHLWLQPSQPIRGGQPVRLTQGEVSDSSPRWSPDGRKIAFASERGEKPALWVLDVASREARPLVDWKRSNHFLSKSAESLCWSPDGKQIAFVAAEEPSAPPPSDPLVISRIQYKSRTAFSDNLHSHIFLVTLADRSVRQLTRGTYDQHSIAWSPRGDEILFLSNREPDPDANFNYDLFAVDLSTGRERRLTDTPGVEFSPVWSPDGSSIAYTATTRPLTTIDSVAEDTHLWVIGREGRLGKDLGAALDRRSTNSQWSGDGKWIYFLAGDHGKTLIYRVPPAGGRIEALLDQDHALGSLSLPAAGDALAFTRTDAVSPAEVWTTSLDGREARPLTALNQGLLDSLNLVRPETLRYPSFDGTEIEGWLMRPVDFQPGRKYPLILTIHGGPHGMYGYRFDHSSQAYAARGYAVLYLNPRGSSGYGQKFSDGCVNNWGGGDYQDLMKGVDYALAKYDWIDSQRLGVIGGSYGGFMTNWVITQTERFKAAVAIASVSNLVSFYGTSLYQDLVHVEFNGFPWHNYELLWKYSPLAHVRNVRTPTLFLHGEQDNDVHITQAEEMYMGLKLQKIASEFVRYPREGHGLREPAHRLDQLERTLAWFDRYLQPSASRPPTPGLSQSKSK